jgi:hypothetical protein
MKFARWVFGAAGIYGLIALSPLYLLEDRIAQDAPPAITHPEYFYGFAGLGVAWQIAFLCIAVDPVRYRLLMLPSSVEKFAFAIAVGILLAKGRVPPGVVGFATVDWVLGVLFVVAYWKTAGREVERRVPESTSAQKDWPA